MRPKKKNINDLQIERFRRLMSWFHFDSVCDVLHVLTIEHFLLHLAVEVFEHTWTNGRNTVAFFIGKIQLQTLRFWNPQSLPNNNQNSATPPVRQIFFTTQLLGDHMTSHNQGSQWHGKAEERKPGNEASKNMSHN